jgi:hypothetical protein
MRLKEGAAPAVDWGMDLPDRETAAYILERLIGEWRRYGHVFSVVRLELPAERVPAAVPRLQAALRDADVLARWDDEELLVLLPETDQVGAESAAERLRDAVRDIPMLAGAVQWTGGSAEGLLSRARWVAARGV